MHYFLIRLENAELTLYRLRFFSRYRSLQCHGGLLLTEKCTTTMYLALDSFKKIICLSQSRFGKIRRIRSVTQYNTYCTVTTVNSVTVSPGTRTTDVDVPTWSFERSRWLGLNPTELSKVTGQRLPDIPIIRDCDRNCESGSGFWIARAAAIVLDRVCALEIAHPQSARQTCMNACNHTHMAAHLQIQRHIFIHKAASYIVYKFLSGFARNRLRSTALKSQTLLNIMYKYIYVAATKVLQTIEACLQPELR